MNQLAKPRLLTLVVNERSDRGRAGRILPKVTHRLHEQTPTAELHIISSNSWTEAEKLARATVLGTHPGDVLLVMGGGGMAHLGLNAAADIGATLGLIPMGAGNDFAHDVDMPRTMDKAVGVTVTGWTCTVDLAHISNDASPRRYVDAVVSTGYDARVNRSTNHIRLQLGALSYGYTTLWELASFSPLHYDTIINGVRRRQEVILVAISNTGIFGGGMRITPEADPIDGLPDITAVGPVSRTTLLRLLPSMYSGAFVKHPCVEQFPVRSIELAGEGLFVMGGDGELGKVPVRVECVPRVLKIFVA